MKRRDYLKIGGAGSIAAVGAYGAYTTVIREAWSDPSASEENLRDLEEEDVTDQTEYEPRNGWTLSGITPEQRDMERIEPLEEWLDEQHAVVGFFLDIGQSDAAEIEQLPERIFEPAWTRGHVPHVFWQPFLPDQESTSDAINREIAAGEWDDEIERWAESIASWVYDEDGDHRRLYINLAPEFNGDWSPWSPAVGPGDEDDFVAMWQRVHGIFSDVGLDEHFVQWIWTLDNTNRGVDREACFPGDEYVDWYGIHGYNWANWTGWLTPEEIYGPTLELLDRLPDNPIAITEFACSSENEDGNHDPEAKDEWLTAAYDYLRETDIRMSLYFNFTKETDWAVFGGEVGSTTANVGDRSYPAYEAYRSSVRQDGVLGPHPDHPRVLTDEEFTGSL